MKKLAILLVFTALASACGGGGGGGDGDNADIDVPFFAGVWRGSMGEVTDTCDIAPSIDTFVHTVNQDGTRIVLDIDDTNAGTTLAGYLNAERTGFTVTRATSERCVTTSEIVYLVADSGNEATVGLEINVQCPTLGCNAVFVGTATRDR